MKIQNKTHYETADLKKLFIACVRRNEKSEGKTQWKNKLTVEVCYSRYGYYTGHAWYGGPMKLRIPKNSYNVLKRTLAIPYLAWLFDHEFMHVRFYGHKQMTKNDMRFHPEDWEWANEFQVRVKETKPKPKRDLRVERYKHTMEMVEKYERQVKRSQGLLKKWQDKKKYYENDVEFLKKMINEEGGLI